ncbi:MAG: hypothetical protein FNP40_08285 [Dehalobacter sp. 4CP]|uniref:PilX N-terminal domain-containing pilus assembly protein n=1 Tax=Dehalobacter sp. CP TaxID=2594474 RepID=UPI0013C8912A|nr:hypothetical protein [Dehalobacter sp. 4CP]
MKKKSDGYALVLTMVLLVVLSVLGTAILSIAFGETKMVANQVENKRAYYAARSGADAMASYIISNSGNSNIATIVSNLITKTSSNPGTGTVGSNTFAVQVSNISSGAYAGDLLIHSEGTADTGALPVKVSLVLTQAVRSAVDATLFSDISPTIGNNTIVGGDLATNGPSINYGNSSQINGSVMLGPDATQADIQNVVSHGDSVSTMTSKVIFPPADPAQFTTTDNGTYPTITLTADGQKLYVKAPSVEDLHKNNNNHVTINWASGVSGTGEVHLLVSDPDFCITGPLTFPAGITLYLYYNGTNTIASNGLLGMNHVFIYAPFATFSVQGGGSGNFTGKMIVKNLNLPSSNVTITNDPTIDLDSIVGVDTYQRNVWLKQ